MNAQKPASAKPAAKHPRYLLVDFENVGEFDIDKVNTQFKIIVFVGTNQRKIPVDLINKTQKLGSRLEWKQVEGHGKNALDFFIAYHIGRTMEKDPEAECVILSKDTGFDPLVKALKKEGKKCGRVEGVGGLK